MYDPRKWKKKRFLRYKKEQHTITANKKIQIILLDLYNSGEGGFLCWSSSIAMI
jgi:hypothetical protein